MAEKITLGDLIFKVKTFADYHSESKKELKDQGKVYYDFGRFFPKTIDSWRGDYSHLALSIDSSLVRATNPDGNKPLTILEFLKVLKDADGSDFEGYKGGTYRASGDTRVWVADYGDTGHTIIVDTTEYLGDLILKTEFGTY